MKPEIFDLESIEIGKDLMIGLILRLMGSIANPHDDCS